MDLLPYFSRVYVTIAMVIFLVTMATPISTHVKEKASIFTARDVIDIRLSRETMEFAPVDVSPW